MSQFAGAGRSELDFSGERVRGTADEREKERERYGVKAETRSERRTAILPRSRLRAALTTWSESRKFSLPVANDIDLMKSSVNCCLIYKLRRRRYWAPSPLRSQPIAGIHRFQAGLFTCFQFICLARASVIFAGRMSRFVGQSFVCGIGP